MAENVKSRAGIKRQITLPNREAAKIAMRSIKIRFWRSIITMAGIVLAIAFLTYVLVSGTIRLALENDPQAQAAAAQASATQIWLIIISLLVCAVGITNAMLMSVTERYREIGTMKCLGALDWFVVKLFLIEAGFQGLVGSTIGAAIGFVTAVLTSMTQYESVLTQAPWGAVILRVFLAILVGGALSVVGTVYPARRAGRMPPADAMRTEI